VNVSENVHILNDPDTMVAVATFARVEEVGVDVSAAEEVVAEEGEPELSVERGKKEDEEEE
jgi:hypothetical protein